MRSSIKSLIMFFSVQSVITSVIGQSHPKFSYFYVFKDFFFLHLNIFSRPGQSHVTDWLINPFPPTALRGRHAQTVRDSSWSYKIDYVIVMKNILNPKGHQNRISGSKVTNILLKGWILPIGGVALGRVCACSLCSMLVFKCLFTILVTMAALHQKFSTHFSPWFFLPTDHLI